MEISERDLPANETIAVTRLSPQERRYFKLRPLLWGGALTSAIIIWSVLVHVITGQNTLLRAVLLIVLANTAVAITFLVLWHLTFRDSLRRSFREAGYTNIHVRNGRFSGKAFHNEPTAGSIRQISAPDRYTRRYHIIHDR